MQKIEPHISKYIDSTIDKALVKARKDFNKESDKNSRALLKEFNEDSKRHMSVVLEKFDNNLKAFKEVAPKIPTEERIREIFHEEIQPLSSDVKLCISEIGQINKKLDYHERRIQNLEHEII